MASRARWMTLPSGAKIKEQVYEHCDVFWVTYTGDRLHRTAHHHTAHDCKVTLRNTTATITLPSGKTMKKVVGKSGFSFAVTSTARVPSKPSKATT